MGLMKTPITQSREWQKLQDDLGEKSFFEQNQDFQYLAILKSTPVGNYLYCPYGPVTQDDTAFRKAIKSLKSLASQHQAIFIRIEPQDPQLINNLPKFAIKSQDLNPKETWLLDLAGNDEDLRSKLPSRLMRYYKSASKKGIAIEVSHNPADIHHLLDLQKKLANEKGINTFSENYLKTELKQPFATLYLVRLYSSEGATRAGDGPGGGPPLSVSEVGEDKVRQDPPGRVIAAGLVFDDKTTRYNLQGAQSDEGKKLHATGILTIQLILDAKAKGLKTFDFWGIAPENATKDHPWAGFTNFKKTFAGYEQIYAGTYDIPLHPAKYKLYQLLRQFNRLIRRA